MTLFQRFKEIRGKQKQDEFADRIGVPLSTYARYERGERKPDAEFLQTFSTQLNVSLNWLLLGIGSRTISEMEPGDAKRRVEGISEEEISTGEYRMTPLIEGGVTAGPDGGLLFDDQSHEYYPFKKTWLAKIAGSSSDQRLAAFVLVQVRGDSMIPTVNPGELVLIDTWPEVRLTPRPGKIYLIRMPDSAIALKRLVLQDANPPRITCLSDNPTLQPFEITVEPGRPITWYILGRVRWVGRELE